MVEATSRGRGYSGGPWRLLRQEGVLRQTRAARVEAKGSENQAASEVGRNGAGGVQEQHSTGVGGVDGPGTKD